MASPSNFDFTVVLFLNKFVGKSRLLDGAVALISDTFILNGALFVSLLWFVWFRNKSEESRIRLFAGGVAALLAVFISRLLQLALPFHVRPLYNTDLQLTWPIGVSWGTLNHWNSFPSDHASYFFALATLVWIHNRPLGVFALLWAAITSSTRIYLGYHYPSDILGGAVIGVLMVILSQWIPLPQALYQLLSWERRASPLFYAVAFIASYQLATLFADIRAIAHVIQKGAPGIPLIISGNFYSVAPHARNTGEGEGGEKHHAEAAEERGGRNFGLRIADFGFVRETREVLFFSSRGR